MWLGIGIDSYDLDETQVVVRLESQVTSTIGEVDVETWDKCSCTRKIKIIMKLTAPFWYI